MSKAGGFTLWLTGLSGAGKTTIGIGVEQALRAQGLRVERLDGDVVRQSLTRDLGFSREDRDRNIERVAFVAHLLSRNEVAVICCFISPYRAARDRTRADIPNFIEVYVDAPVAVCAARDTKGLYAQALRGELDGFTGVTDPYEAPLHPELILSTASETPAESIARVLGWLREHGFVSLEYAS